MECCFGLLRRTLWIVLAALVSFAAMAEDLAPGDARAVRAVIEAQLDAFRRDDAPRAFAYAAAGIREAFGTAQSFIEMVRRSYPVVYRPKSVQFDAPILDEGEVVQPVRMTDAEGRAWLAVYPMQRQPDGGWRINGCQLGRLAGREV
jgi:hypothetical protein